MRISEKAYAKLNLSLDVSAPRNDGYHDMVMVMQSISLCDELDFTLDNSGRVSATSNFRYIPNDERNLAVKAVNKYLDRIGRRDVGCRINIIKNIPSGAGMGGGSSDAAAALRAMNRAFDNCLSGDELLELAAQTGSDVPFCVRGGTQLAKGRGEILTDLPDMPMCSLAICKPSFSISTPELFRKLDNIRIRTHPDTPGMLAAVNAGDLSGMCRRMYNVFEDIDDRRMRTVAEIKSKLLDMGACGAMMTGTGSAVFGVFNESKDAVKAAELLNREYGFGRSAEPTGRTEI